MEKGVNTTSNKPLFDESFEEARILVEDSSKLLENIMTSMGDGVSIQDRNLRIVYQNKTMIDNFGSHVGDYCYNIYEKRNRACDGCPIVQSFETGQVNKALRVGITKDGTPFRFENIASVLRNEQSKIVAGIELCRIVEDRERAYDELKETVEQLKQTQEQLVRSEKLAGIGQLAAGVAHEINNPAGFVLSNLGTMRDYVREFFTFVESLEKLCAIDSYADHLHIKCIEEGVQKVVNNKDYAYLKNELPDVIEESLHGMQRIKTIVSNLMTFAQTNDEEKDLIDTNALLESALMLLENKIEAKKCQVDKKFGALLPLPANPQQLSQMFLNMLLNAIQAIEEGGTITVKTYLKEDRVNIEITDDGKGIPQDIVKNIFNPFFTTREVGKGTGLGLSIAYRIIENHNGSIDVQSGPGRGTTFTIKLPLSYLDELTK